MAFLLLAGAAGFVVTAAIWVVARPVLRSRDLRLQLPSVVAGAAVCAALATSHATGVGVADLAWRLVLGATTAALAAYAPAAVLVAATAALALAAEPAWGLASAAASGANASTLAVGRRSRPLGAATGAVAAATSLHLERPDGLLAAAVGIAAVVAITAAGMIKMSNRRRRRVVRRLPVAAAPLVVLLGLGTVSVVSARSHLEQGVAQAKAALKATRSGDTVEGEQRMRTASSAFARGRDDLDA
jgi:hypothetical protein